MHRVALLCLVLVLGGGAADQAQVQRVPDPPPGSVGLRGEVRYSVTRDDVTAILSYVPTSQMLILRIDGRPPPVSLAEQAALLEPLLVRLSQDQGKPAPLTVLLTDHAEVIARLAAVLASCANWNGRVGRPTQGALAPFLVDTLNRHDLAGEIATVFARHGYRFAAAGASLITEGRVAEVTDRLVPTSIGYLGFVADLRPETLRRIPWPAPYRHSTC